MLGLEDFMTIQALVKRGVYLCDIAEQLGVHRKTVSRAVQRGGAPPSSCSLASWRAARSSCAESLAGGRSPRCSVSTRRWRHDDFTRCAHSCPRPRSPRRAPRRQGATGGEGVPNRPSRNRAAVRPGGFASLGRIRRRTAATRLRRGSETAQFIEEERALLTGLRRLGHGLPERRSRLETGIGPNAFYIPSRSVHRRSD
jgi:hypothetical protein